VIDPPLATNENTQSAASQETIKGQLLGGGSPTSLDHVVALFNQSIAGGFTDHNGTPITNALSQTATNQEEFLAQPRHG
jgi:hypothetical protein